MSQCQRNWLLSKRHSFLLLSRVYLTAFHAWQSLISISLLTLANIDEILKMEEKKMSSAMHNLLELNISNAEIFLNKRLECSFLTTRRIQKLRM